VQQAADRSMRYVLAVQPQGGQPNMSYEGMRCGDRHLRSFAFGDNTNRRWIAPRNNVWRKFDSYVNANDQVRSRLMAIDDLADLGYDPDFGARPVKRAIQDYVLNDLSRKILEGKIGKEVTLGKIKAEK